MKKIIVLFTLIFSFFPVMTQAQNFVNADAPSIIAFAYDHRNQTSLLMAKAILEEGNASLHNITGKDMKNYKAMQDSLDAYTRSFQIIDLIVNSASLAFNAYETYNDVSEKGKKIVNMLKVYNDKILMRGKVETADTAIIGIVSRCVEGVSDDVEEIIKSFSQLIKYATNMNAATTADLLRIVNNLNDSMDHISRIMNNTHKYTFLYLNARLNMWSQRMFRSRTVKSICDDAIGRWHNNALKGSRVGEIIGY